MSETGTLRAPEQLPDWSKEWPGEASVRFFLRETPKPFVRLMAGTSNQSFLIRSVDIPEWPALPLRARIFTGARPSPE